MNMRKVPFQRKRPVQSAETKVYSYYRSSRNEQVPKEDKNRNPKLINLKRTSNNAIRWLLVVVMLLLALAVISVDTTPIIRLNENEKPLREVSVYREGIGDLINRNLANKTKLTFDYISTDKKVREQYPEVKNVEISLDLFGRKPVVRLTLYQPTFQVVSKGVSWVVDERGVAVAKSEDQRINQSTRALPVITDSLNIGAEVGDSLLTPDEALFIKKILDYIRIDGLSASSINLPAVPQEVDIKIEGDNYFTKLNTSEEVEGQYGAWMAARGSLISKASLPAEYIDVRAGEKVYWK